MFFYFLVCYLCLFLLAQAGICHSVHVEVRTGSVLPTEPSGCPQGFLFVYLFVYWGQTSMHISDWPGLTCRPEWPWTHRDLSSASWVWDWCITMPGFLNYPTATPISSHSWGLNQGFCFLCKCSITELTPSAQVIFDYFFPTSHYQVAIK